MPPFGTDPIFISNDSSQRSIHGYPKAGAAAVFNRETIGGDMIDTNIVSTQKALATDMDVTAIDPSFDAEADAVLGFIHRRKRNRKFTTSCAQRFCNRVREIRLGRSCERQQVIRRQMRIVGARVNDTGNSKA